MSSLWVFVWCVGSQWSKHMIRCWILIGSAIIGTNFTSAQHCAPLYESYLSRIDVSRDAKVSINFDLSYSKTGGRYKEAYQAYVVVYKCVIVYYRKAFFS